MSIIATTYTLSLALTTNHVMDQLRSFTNTHTRKYFRLYESAQLFELTTEQLRLCFHFDHILFMSFLNIPSDFLFSLQQEAFWCKCTTYQINLKSFLVSFDFISFLVFLICTLQRSSCFLSLRFNLPF